MKSDEHQIRVKVDRNKHHSSSVPTSPASPRLESVVAESIISHQRKQSMLSRNASPPGTPTKHSAENHELFKKKVSRRTGNRKRAMLSLSDNSSTTTLSRLIFRHVFMTKKRTRDNKSVMSEFKGGDLNKYTAKTYAIQNGNEVFGGCCSVEEFSHDCHYSCVRGKQMGVERNERLPQD
ncbi:unnamed protein product [Nippostrongylus brasiliensis]|uniref:Uncharacterized protein n=1 Tax=Nippostrongylus brasiliensis TaxID=27835 RepID=A0A158R0E5_NIPBR|nr:unnamed protein product [Nippostrongylus brasiliensis]